MRLLTIVAGLLFAQVTTLVTVATAKPLNDEDAIKRVVLAETDRFFARDFDGWSATFVHAPRATQGWNNPDGSYVHRLGWDTISARIREFMQKNPQPDRTPMTRENFLIQNYGNAAFVTFDKYLGDRATAKPIREIRMLEKTGGEWRIVCVVALIDHLK